MAAPVLLPVVPTAPRTCARAPASHQGPSLPLPPPRFLRPLRWCIPQVVRTQGRPDVHVELIDVGFEGFVSDTIGGALLASGVGVSVTCTRCVFASNDAKLAGAAVAISDGAMAELDACRFAGNTAGSYPSVIGDGDDVVALSGGVVRGV